MPKDVAYVRLDIKEKEQMEPRKRQQHKPRGPHVSVGTSRKDVVSLLETLRDQPLVDRMKSASDEIKEWVKTCDYALTEVEKASGITRFTVYQCMRPGWNPTLKTLLALAKAHDELERKG